MGAGDVAAEPAFRPFLDTVRLLSTKARRDRRTRRRTHKTAGVSPTQLAPARGLEPAGTRPFLFRSRRRLVRRAGAVPPAAVQREWRARGWPRRCAPSRRTAPRADDERPARP